MKLAHLDIFAGISGDMLLGAMIDCGVDADRLGAELAKMAVPRFRLGARKVSRGEMSGTQIALELPEEHAHRNILDIERLVGAAPYPDRVKERTGRIFRLIAEAEARIHRMPVEEVHFHEIGAMDSILDVTGAVLGLELLGAERVTSSSVPLGRGTIQVAHGTMPVPAPATLELLKGVPCRPGLADGEASTPTGAAFVAALAESFGDLPPSTPLAIGYGAGSRQGERIPNLLRLVLAETADALEGEVVELTANIDDMNPQFYGYLSERLFEAGALDVWLTAAQMKKGRPGTVVSALAKPENVQAVRDLLLAETSTLGVRYTRLCRWELPRSIVEVETRFGRMRVKRAGSKAAPEYEDCARAAREAGIPLRDVYEEVMRRAREGA